MYSPQIIGQRLSKIAPQILTNYNFNLQYYSIDYCNQMRDYINNLIDYDLYWETVDKKADEVQIVFKDANCEKEFNSIEISNFRMNEQIISTYDCNYFMDRYYIIQDIHDKFINFKANKLQLINRNIRARLELARRAIKKLTLKARQTGETTDGLGVLLHRICLIENSRSVIASYRDSETTKLARMFNNGLNRVAFWLKPKIKELDKRRYYGYTNGSIINMGYGTERALARGSTLTLFHLTEIAKYLYPSESVESALSKAAHESVWNLGTIEGTAEKMGDWFDTFWHTQVKLSNEGLEDFYCSFIPYVCRGDDIYPTKAWINARYDAFSKYKPKPETIQHKFKIENYIKTHKDLLDVMGSNYNMSKETMFYYEVEKEKYKQRGQLHLFYREMPSDPEEAFQNPEKTVYPIEIITELNDSAQKEVPRVYKIKGDVNEIAPDLQIDLLNDEIDRDLPILNINTPRHWNFQTSYQLYPLKFKGWDRLDYKNKFILFDYHNEDFEYTLGGDFSDGLGENLSDDFVIEGYRKGTIANKDKQVLEFASPNINPSNSWPFILTAGLLLSTPSKLALMSLEAERGGGQEAIDKLLLLGWHNIFELIDISKTGESKRFGRLGWFTNRRTRPIMVNHFFSFIKGRHLELMSPFLVSELKGLTKKESVSAIYNTETEKVAGKIDNRWIASCIALYSSHQNEMLGYEKAAWERRTIKNDDVVNYASYNYGEELSNLNKGVDIFDSLEYNRSIGNFDGERNVLPYYNNIEDY